MASNEDVAMKVTPVKCTSTEAADPPETDFVISTATSDSSDTKIRDVNVNTSPVSDSDPQQNQMRNNSPSMMQQNTIYSNNMHPGFSPQPQTYSQMLAQHPPQRPPSPIWPYHHIPTDYYSQFQAAYHPQQHMARQIPPGFDARSMMYPPMLQYNAPGMHPMYMPMNATGGGAGGYTSLVPPPPVLYPNHHGTPMSPSPNHAAGHADFTRGSSGGFMPTPMAHPPSSSMFYPLSSQRVSPDSPRVSPSAIDPQQRAVLQSHSRSSPIPSPRISYLNQNGHPTLAGVHGNARIRCPSPTPSAFQLPINSHRAAMVALQQRAAAAVKTTTSSPPTNLTISPSLPAHTIDMQITPKPAIVGSKIGVTSTTPDNQKPFTVTEVTNSLQSCTVEQNSVVDPKCAAEQPETQSQHASDEIDNAQNDEKSSCNVPAPDVSPATKKNTTKEKRTKKQTLKHPKVALRKRVMNAQFLAKINHTAADEENTTGNETSSTPKSPDSQADENQAKTENVKTIGYPGNEAQSSSNSSPELKKDAPNHRIVHPRFRFLHNSSPTTPPPQSNNNATVQSPNNNDEYDILVQTHNSTVQNETKLESGVRDCKESSSEKVLRDEKRGTSGESKKKKLKRRWSECNEKISKDSHNKEKGRQKKNTDITAGKEETVQNLP